jgi:hypothetical protein
MKSWNRGLRGTISLAVLALGFASIAQGQGNQSATPPGLFITPTALPNAVQQDLNPGLALPYFATNHPSFVAGEAVRAAVSPDGKTLAILTAGMNSLYFPNNAEPGPGSNVGKLDTTASTQFLFLYDIDGANKTNPILKQVIQQPNAHVGLVWSPDSKTVYAAGGCDDAVYAYTNKGSSFAQSGKISLAGCGKSRKFCNEAAQSTSNDA